MKKTILVLLILSLTLNCSSRDEDPKVETSTTSTVTPTEYIGKWKASHVQIMDNSGTGYIGTTKDYYVNFTTSTTAEIKSANGIFTGTTTYKKNGTNDSFTVTATNNDKVIINSWESETYLGSRVMTLNFSNRGSGDFNYNFIVKK